MSVFKTTKNGRRRRVSAKKSANQRIFAIRTTALLVMLVAVASVTVYIGRTSAQTWQEPSAPPTTPNIAPPIWNQNASAQTGNFWISGNGYFGGKVGIGTSNPSGLFQVANEITLDNVSGNNYLGNSAGASTTTGYENTAVGVAALLEDTTGYLNTAVGNSAMYNNITGIYNAAFGEDALQGNVAGSYNTALGAESLGLNTSSNNTAVGYFAMEYLSSGGNNTAVGYYAGSGIGPPQLSSLSNDTFLGYGARSGVNGVSNSMALGYNAVVAASNQTVIGNSSVASTTIYGATTINGSLNTTGTLMQNGVAVCVQGGTCTGGGGGGGGAISGSGTTNNVAKFTGANSIGNSIMTDNGSGIGVNIASAIFPLEVSGTIASRTTNRPFMAENIIGAAQYNGNWNSAYYWGIGPATTSGDSTIRIGMADSNGNWTGSQVVNLLIGGTMTAGTANLSSNGNDGFYETSSDGGYRAPPFGGDKGFLFHTNGSSGGSTTMYVGLIGSYAGRVGINTTAPAYQLDVNGNVHASNFIAAGTLSASGVSSVGSIVSTSGNISASSGSVTANWGQFDNFLRVGAGAFVYTAGDLGTARSDGTGVIFLGSGGGHFLFWDNQGWYEMPNGNIYLPNGGVYANVGWLTSDRRLKKNITDLAGVSSLDLVKELAPVTFDWKDPAVSAGTQYGFVAQDIQKIFPSLVSTDKAGMFNLNYTGLIAPVVGAVQELDKTTLKVTGDGSVFVSGDLEVKNNAWGAGTDWIVCPTQGICSCPNGSYMTQIKDQGKAISCSKL